MSSVQTHDPRNRDSVIRELSREFPREVIRQKPAFGGGKPLDYVPAQQVIYRLNYATGGDWGFVPLEYIWDGSEEIARCRGQLTIPIVSSLPRGDIGTQRVGRSKAGVLSDELLKGAATDCLKRCARQFGVALHLYGPDVEEALGFYLEQAPSDYQTADGTRVVLDDGLVRTYHGGETGLQVPGVVYSGPPIAEHQPAQSVPASPGLQQYDPALGMVPAQTTAPTQQNAPQDAGAPGRLYTPPQAQTPHQGQHSAPQGQSQQAPQQQQGPRRPDGPSEFPRPDQPMTDAQLNRVRQEARRLGIDLESRYFQDGMVLRYGRRFETLDARSASDLLNTMINDPAKLNADQLGKEIVLMHPFVAEYWLARISAPQTSQQEAAEIRDAILARYKQIDAYWVPRIKEALIAKGVTKNEN